MELYFNLLPDWTPPVKIIARFALDFAMIILLVKFIYFGYKKDKEFSFTFILFNIIIFFVCYIMLDTKISMGFAFGLFAIFGILRYRTNTIPIKEMTYLFTSIAFALINAIGPWHWSTIMINIFLLGSVFIMEKMWFGDREQYINFVYERIALLQTGNHTEAIADITKRSGLNVTRLEVKSYNFLNDSAELRVFYKP